jgi:hypothetical protein
MANALRVGDHLIERLGISTIDRIKMQTPSSAGVQHAV